MRFIIRHVTRGGQRVGVKQRRIGIGVGVGLLFRCEAASDWGWDQVTPSD